MNMGGSAIFLTSSGLVVIIVEDVKSLVSLVLRVLQGDWLLNYV